MPKTLAERIRENRLAAVNSTFEEIADFIWENIVDAFDSFDKYELECLNYISVVVKERVDRLEIVMITKNRDNAYDESEEMWDLFFSSEKLMDMEEIMELVLKKGEAEGLEVWMDDNMDDDEGNGYYLWGFHLGEFFQK